MYLNRQITTRLQSTAGYSRNVFCSVIRHIYIVYTYRYIHINIYIYIHLCIFVYAYIHAHIHIYTSIHTYVPGCIGTDSTAHGCDQRQAIIERVLSFVIYIDTQINIHIHIYQDVFGQTALHMAAINGNLQMVDLLLGTRY